MFSGHCFWLEEPLCAVFNGHLKKIYEATITGYPENFINLQNRQWNEIAIVPSALEWMLAC